MYSLSSLQLLQTQARMLGVPAIMLCIESKKLKDNDCVEVSITENGFWGWLKSKVSEKEFAEYRLQASLYNELYLFDIQLPKEIIDREPKNGWTITQLDCNGQVLYAN